MNKPRRLHLPELLLLLVAALLLLVFLAVTLVPSVLGLRALVVTSGSMEPALRRGDLVYVRQTDFSDIRPGDLVSFTLADATVTHRVYAIDYPLGTLRTKADAGNRLDTTPVTQAQILGVVVYKLPMLGHLSLSLEPEEEVAP